MGEFGDIPLSIFVVGLIENLPKSKFSYPCALMGSGSFKLLVIAYPSKIDTGSLGLR